MNDYKETFSYDANGNILTVLRNATTAGGNTLAMDALTYHYQANTNKLTYVNDTVGAATHSNDIDNQSAGNYSYDKIGNLISDNAENLQSINWTVYGKIKSITKPATEIHYSYDAAGNRVHKKITGTTAAEEIYVRDAQGNPLAVYRLQGDSTFWKEQHLYGSSRLGIYQYHGLLPAAPVVTNGTVTTLSDSLLMGNTSYELSNHLGNVLAVINDKKIGVSSVSDSSLTDHYVADVLSLQDYYAFGSQMLGRSYLGNKYRYGFNGKENDNEIKGEGNQQDYGMRIYDARIAKFLSVDPISKDYPELTPYQFASNSPIENSDLDGAESLSRIKAGLQQRWDIQMRTASINDANKKAKEAQTRALMRYIATVPPSNYTELSQAPNKVSDNVRRLRQEHHMDPETGEKTAMGRLFMNKNYDNLNKNIVERIAELAVGDGIGRAVFKGGALIFKFEKEAARGVPRYLYHYTNEAAAQNITQVGLQTKYSSDGFLYLTNKRNLSALQAQIELALPANRALPNSLLRIDTKELSPFIIRRVQGNLPGMGAGGGTEFLFNQNIPSSAIKIIK